MVTPVKKKVRRRITKKTMAAAESKAKEKKESPEHEGPELIASALQKLQLASEMQMKLLREEIKNIQLSANQPPIEWVFDIVRDSDTGLISQIKASAPSTKATRH